jgi:mono/diheme cytochrome c family protein
VAPTAQTVVGTVPGEVDVSQGDARAGRDVFLNVADPTCGSCHAYEAAGSTQTLGPDLDDSLADASPEFILESITNPSAEIAEGYQDVMPKDYGQQLTEKQLADLVAFLEPQS